MAKPNTLEKCPTGIDGLDDLTFGGLPRHRPTLVCGGPGSGKTLLGAEFLVRGATRYNEPGVFFAFEETAREIRANVASLGFNLDRLIARKRLLVEHIRLIPDGATTTAAGDFDLDGLFVRLNYAIDSIKAKRVVLDTLETLFGGVLDPTVVRAELSRLFNWLKAKGVTAIVTAERSGGALTRHGIEEFVSDCVIVLDNRTIDEVTTRRLRVVKYRGSAHATNEFPFLVGAGGLSILPITSMHLNHKVSAQRISSGVKEIDTMLTGGGFYRGSSILISGTAGTGKSSLAASMAVAASRRNERTIYFAFEESPDQIQRNMRSIGLDLAPSVKNGRLRFSAWRPNFHGLETHLVTMIHEIDQFRPRLVVVDPISNFSAQGSDDEVRRMLTRLIDHLKAQQVTALFVNLADPSQPIEQTSVGISSLMDNWLMLRSMEISGERNRVLYMLKARGLAHSNQVREFVLSSQGIKVLPVYAGPSGVLTGSARLAQESREVEEELVIRQESERRHLGLDRKRAALEAQIAALRAGFEAEAHEIRRTLDQDQQRAEGRQVAARRMAVSRHADETRPRRRSE